MHACGDILLLGISLFLFYKEENVNEISEKENKI